MRSQMYYETEAKAAPRVSEGDVEGLTGLLGGLARRYVRFLEKKAPRGRFNESAYWTGMVISHTILFGFCSGFVISYLFVFLRDLLVILRH